MHPTNESAPPTRAEADAEYAALLRRATRGGLFADDFRRIDELLPYVSPGMRGPFAREQ